MLALGLLLSATQAFALRPYEPDIPDPLTEAWRWRVFEETRNMGLRCMAETRDGGLVFGSDKGIHFYNGIDWTGFDESKTSIGTPVNQVCVSTAGEIYAANDRGIARYSSNGWKRVFPLLQDLPFQVNNLRATRDNGILAASSLGVLWIQNEQVTLLTTSKVGAIMKGLCSDLRIVTVPDTATPKEAYPFGAGLWGAWGEFMGIHRGLEAFLVIEVASDSPAERAGICPGEVVKLRENSTGEQKNSFLGVVADHKILEIEVSNPLSGESRLLELQKEALNAEVNTFQISDVLITQNGSLWFAHQEGNLTRLLPESTDWSQGGAWQTWDPGEHFQAGHSPRLMESKDGKIYAISNERVGGNVQVFDGSEWTGFSLESLPSGSNNNTSILETNDGSIYIGGFKLHRLQKGNWKVFTIQDIPIPYHRTRLLQHSDGSLWVLGLGQNVVRCELSTDRWSSYAGLVFASLLPGGDIGFISNENEVVIRKKDRWCVTGKEDGLCQKVMRLLATGKGEIWALGSENGIAATSRLDPESQRWHTTLHPNIALESPKANAIYEASDGRIWFGAYQGVISFKNGAYEYYLPPDAPAQVYSICETTDGNIWFGGDHLSHFRDGRWTALQQPLQLKSWIETLAADDHNGLWVGTRAYGIFHITGDQWRQFTVDDGLSDNNIHTIYLDPEGHVVSKTQAGLCRFDGEHWSPIKLPVNSTSEPYFSDIAIDNEGFLWFNFDNNYVLRYHQESQPPDTKILEAPARVNFRDSILVSWLANDAWNQTTQNDLLFSTRIDGGPWSPYSSNRQQAFSNLPVGAHTLEVRSRDNDFNVDPTPATHRFKVLPPYWMQWWFVLSLVLVAGIIAYLSLKVYINVRNLREAREHLELNVKRRTSELQSTVHQLADEIQRRKKTEENLLQAMEKTNAAANARTEFLAVMGHEIRTPLNAILGFAQLLTDSSDANEINEFTEHIIERGDHLLKLINEILEFTSLSSGLIRGEEGVFSPILFFSNLVKSFEPMARERDIGLCFRPAENLPQQLCCHQTYLTQIVSNLIGNAIKFTEKGFVTVDVSAKPMADGDHWKLRVDVHDTGIGIDPLIQSKLFEPFSQGDSSYVRQYEGVGLGLAICKRIVNLLGGEIAFESELGKGSSFYMELPTKTPKANERIFSTATPDTNRVLRKLKILLVEDDRLNKRILELILSREGHQVESVENGEIAIRKLSNEPYDLIFMDVHMPEMDGMEATRRIRRGDAGEKASNLPIIGVSAFSGDEARDCCLTSGMTDFVAKPVRVKDLTNAIHRVFV